MARLYVTTVDQDGYRQDLGPYRVRSEKHARRLLASQREVRVVRAVLAFDTDDDIRRLISEESGGDR